MKTTLLIGSCLLYLLLLCPLAYAATDKPTDPSQGGKVAPLQVLKLDVNLDEQKTFQIYVDKGHQPWRLEPLYVADVAIISLKLDKGMTYMNCKELSRTKDEAVIVCRGNATYKVFLKRLVKPKGIWTVLKVEVYKQ